MIDSKEQYSIVLEELELRLREFNKYDFSYFTCYSFGLLTTELIILYYLYPTESKREYWYKYGIDI